MPYVGMSSKCKTCQTYHTACWADCEESKRIDNLFALCHRCRHYLACEQNPETCGYWDSPNPEPEV